MQRHASAEPAAAGSIRQVFVGFDRYSLARTRKPSRQGRACLPRPDDNGVEMLHCGSSLLDCSAALCSAYQSGAEHVTVVESQSALPYRLDYQVAAQTLSVNGGPVAFSWNKEQSDAARNRKDRTVIKHSSVTDVVPQQTSHNARDQF
jgi:hypothetical protein